MPPNPIQPTPIIPQQGNHKLLITLLSIGAVIILAVGSILLLQLLAPKATPIAQAPKIDLSQTVKQSSDKLLAAFPTYAVSNDHLDTYIEYIAPGKMFSVSIKAVESAILYAKQPAINDDAMEFKDAATEFFEANDFNEVTQKLSTASGVTYSTYKNEAAICQLQSKQGTLDISATYTIGCIDKLASSDEYSIVDNLLGLYAGPSKLSDYTQVSRTSASKTNKTLSVVNIIAQGSLIQLAFVSVDGTWHYVGRLNDDSGDASKSTGKYIPSEELTNAFKDPVYGAFLREQLG